MFEMKLILVAVISFTVSAYATARLLPGLRWYRRYQAWVFRFMDQHFG